MTLEILSHHAQQLFKSIWRHYSLYIFYKLNLWISFGNEASKFLCIPAKVGQLSEVFISVPGQRDPQHMCSAICCVPCFPWQTFNGCTLEATLSPNEINILGVSAVSFSSSSHHFITKKATAKSSGFWQLFKRLSSILLRLRDHAF